MNLLKIAEKELFGDESSIDFPEGYFNSTKI